MHTYVFYMAGSTLREVKGHCDSERTRPILATIPYLSLNLSSAEQSSSESGSSSIKVNYFKPTVLSGSESGVFDFPNFDLEGTNAYKSGTSGMIEPLGHFFNIK